MRTKEQIGKEMDRLQRILVDLAENQWDSGYNGPTKEVKQRYRETFKQWKALLKERDSLP